VSLIRVLRTAAVTLTHTFLVDEVPTDADAAVTVTVERLDGTLVVAGAATHTGPGVYTFAMPGQTSVDTLTVDWTGAILLAPISVRDYVDIAGGFLFGLAEVRAAHPGLASTATYPVEMLAERRIQIEQECETLSGQAWVPRFARVACSGNGSAMLRTPHLALRTVRAVSVVTSSATTPFSAGELARVVPLESGILHLRNGYWPVGYQNIIVEVEHGADLPPEEIRQAAILRMRSVLATTKTSIPDRAVSYTVNDGGVFRLATPSATSTGIPDVDAAYSRYRIDQGGFA